MLFLTRYAAKGYECADKNFTHRITINKKPFCYKQKKICSITISSHTYLHKLKRGTKDNKIENIE